MAITKTKGDIGEAMICADICRRGYRVAFPFGEDWSCDLIVLRGRVFEKVQCKYTESKNGVIAVQCRSSNNWSIKKYSSDDVDWIACYDKSSDECYYIPAKMLGNGRREIKLRLSPPRNNQRKKILCATDFLKF
jgi:hypothetical protein